MTPAQPQLREPPHAKHWQQIRESCGRSDCPYPFCRCDETAKTLNRKEAA